MQTVNDPLDFNISQTPVLSDKRFSVTTQRIVTKNLSSASVVMNESGLMESAQRYMPFGEVRELAGYDAITETDFGYTNQRNYADMGLMDYHARYYSPTLGRFTQPDSVIPDLTNSQAWNRYAYVNNSPIMYVDPSGHKQICMGDDSFCLDSDASKEDILRSFSVTLVTEESGNIASWEGKDELKDALINALMLVGHSMRRELGNNFTIQKAFQRFF